MREFDYKTNWSVVRTAVFGIITKLSSCRSPCTLLVRFGDALYLGRNEPKLRPALWTPYPEPGKIRLGPYARELPEIMAAEYYFALHSPPSSGFAAPRVPPFELCGIPSKYRTILRRIRSSTRRSLIFRCIFNQV